MSSRRALIPRAVCLLTGVIPNDGVLQPSEGSGVERYVSQRRSRARFLAPRLRRPRLKPGIYLKARGIGMTLTEFEKNGVGGIRIK